MFGWSSAEDGAHCVWMEFSRGWGLLCLDGVLHRKDLIVFGWSSPEDGAHCVWMESPVDGAHYVSEQIQDECTYAGSHALAVHWQRLPFIVTGASCLPEI